MNGVVEWWSDGVMGQDGALPRSQHSITPTLHHSASPPRSIVHLDADAFFASVEQAADARLRGKPIAVGGEKRGIIASASYEARKFGIYTPMPTTMARRLCPKLIMVPGDFEKYELFSRLMFSYVYDFTPDVEIGSIDEGYFDLTGVRKPAVHVAETVQHAIRQALKLSVSEGIGANKLISQIASKLRKPAAFEFVPAGYEAKFLSPLANKWLPGIGPKVSIQFNAAGLARIGQIAGTPVELLGLLIGSRALQLRNFARGIDERPVIPVRAPAKSYGEQETFAADTTDEPFLEATLRRMADKLMAKVREDRKSIRSLTVKVRYNDMDEQQASASLKEPTDLETDTYSPITALLRKAWQRRVSLRLVSLKLSNIYEGRFWGGLGLDAQARQHDAELRLVDVVDQLRVKFGRGVVLRGHDFILRESSKGSEEKNSRVFKTGRYSHPERIVSFSPGSRGTSYPANGSEKYASPEGVEPPQRPFPPVENPGHNPFRVESMPPLPSQGSSFLATLGFEAESLQDSCSPSKPENTPCESLNESPASYQAAVVQRQRLGNDAMRRLALTDARKASNPSPELRFRVGCDSQGAKINVSSARARRAGHLAVPLNVHSYYSFLDSTLSPRAIVDWAVRRELPAIALTDKNNLHGAVEFAQAAAEAGIKPIIGAEIEWNGHRVCLYVENQKGYENLCRILSAKGERVPSSPKRGPSRSAAARNSEWLGSKFLRRRTVVAAADRDGLRSGATVLPLPGGEGRGEGNFDFDTTGLLALSSCAAPAPFFPNRFYLEVSDIEAFEKHPAPLPCVASLPVHYELPSDRWKYDIIQSIRTLTLLRQQHPEKHFDGEYHFRAGAEMDKRFAAHPELLAHSREIAERCSFAFSLGKPQFPGYPTPDRSPPAIYLRRLVMEGLHRRYPKNYARFKPQLEQELAIITEVGYEEYFLVMWDILQECRRRGIEWITRGSAADSLACYCLEISGVCPIRFDLYFRRFLNKDRMALNKLPDIDVDFPHDRKDDVVDLIFEKYGPEYAAVVGGFSTFQSRSAFAEIAKVLGVSEFQVRRITERLPHFSRATELAEAVAITQECRDLPFQEEPYRTALSLAAFLDGFPRYPKMHPCGVVLSRQRMSEITPCFTSSKGYPTTHFDMDSIEAVGLVKMDILAQGGLAVMRDVREMLAQNPKAELRRPNERNHSQFLHPEPFPEFSSFGLRISDFGFLEPWADPNVWQLIASGNARAVHHIESPAMISLCKMCNVQDIDTLIAIVSVIRPGAANESKKMEFARRYQGLSPTHYHHPSLEPCLRSTYGLVVYEEHILQICEAFAGLPPGRADVLRRALGKDKTELIAQIKNEFADCARKLGRTESEITEVWELVSGFRGYAFCKAHSTAYGVEAYQAAWLKLNFPAEFMTAVLTNGKGFYSPLVYVLECHRLGIPLLPPCVNEPGPAFKVSRVEGRGAGGQKGSDSIRVPVLNVKGLTNRTKDAILRERNRGVFSSLTDFVARIQPLPEEMESLVRVGAFDKFGKSRTAQYWEFKSLQGRGSRVEGKRGSSDNSSEQLALFENADLNRLPSVPLSEPERLQHLRAEEELIGYPVSGHPLELFPDIAWDTYCPINALGQHIGKQIVTCGLVIEQRLFHQVTGEPMKFITISDWTGIVETELFAKTYKSYGLSTIRYRVLEITATVEPFENGRGHTLRVLRAGKPRTRK
jgi:DNA-directed DNA polymerase III PolC